MIETKSPLFEFVIDQRIAGHDLASVEGRVSALASAAPIVAEIKDGGIRGRYEHVLARRLGEDLRDVHRAVSRAATRAEGGMGVAAGAGTRTGATPPGAVPGDAAGDVPTSAPRATIATLPRTSDAALERDALMGILQYGHVVDAAEIDAALALPMTVPALDAVRQAVQAQPDRTRIGWAVTAAEAVREPFRSLGWNC
jgi:DNA primase